MRLLPTLGGQTGLNTAVTLAESGVLKEYNVEMIGASLDVIHEAEDREKFRHAIEKIGLQDAQERFCAQYAGGDENCRRNRLPSYYTGVFHAWRNRERRRSITVKSL